MLQRIRFPYLNNYQNNEHYRSENPMDEVWDRINRYSSIGILKKEYATNIHPESRDELIDYIATRISQANEFRNASHGQSLITKPLSLYYAMLILLRADIALCFEVKSHKSHGLHFLSNENIMESSVVISGGTFQEYLEYKGISSKKDVKISLSEALGNIIEMGLELKEYRDNKLGFTPFVITAYPDGDMELNPLKK
jgi:hypothetical protein